MNCDGRPSGRVVFAAGCGMDGSPRVAVTVCPCRLLAEEPWAEEFVEWWLWSVPWRAGKPAGLPRWPFPGGLRRQPRRLFEACRLLQSEWGYLTRAKPAERQE